MKTGTSESTQALREVVEALSRNLDVARSCGVPGAMTVLELRSVLNEVGVLERMQTLKKTDLVAMLVKYRTETTARLRSLQAELEALEKSTAPTLPPTCATATATAATTATLLPPTSAPEAPRGKPAGRNDGTDPLLATGCDAWGKIDEGCCDGRAEEAEWMEEDRCADSGAQDTQTDSSMLYTPSAPVLPPQMDDFAASALPGEPGAMLGAPAGDFQSQEADGSSTAGAAMEGAKARGRNKFGGMPSRKPATAAAPPLKKTPSIFAVCFSYLLVCAVLVGIAGYCTLLLYGSSHFLDHMKPYLFVAPPPPFCGGAVDSSDCIPCPESATCSGWTFDCHPPLVAFEGICVPDDESLLVIRSILYHLKHQHSLFLCSSGKDAFLTQESLFRLLQAEYSHKSIKAAVESILSVNGSYGLYHRMDAAVVFWTDKTEELPLLCKLQLSVHQLLAHKDYIYTGLVIVVTSFFIWCLGKCCGSRKRQPKLDAEQVAAFVISMLQKDAKAEGKGIPVDHLKTEATKHFNLPQGALQPMWDQVAASVLDNGNVRANSSVTSCGVTFHTWAWVS
ncbi:hypothetical protein Pelo_10248 [Pelomyxa schiedti]|nr:hypothetical protein Pelo_10248 [Pelomyxa schiedti]